MLNLINNLTPTQWIGLGVGVMIVAISSKDFFVKLFKSQDKNNIVIDVGDPDLDITSLVAKWEVLSDACKKAKANDAYEKLQEVFPLLVTVYNDEA